MNAANVNVHLYLPRQIDGHAAETGPELDEEMEKVFAMDAGEKFDVSRLGSPSESAGSDRDRDRDRGPPPRYGGDRDFNRKSLFDVIYFIVSSLRELKIRKLTSCSEYRKRSYPHPHMPLKSLHSRSMRRHLSP